MPNVSPPENFVTFLVHVALVILAVGAAMLIAYSPSPFVGVVVLALVMGVELPIVVRDVFGGSNTDGGSSSN